MAMNPQLMQNAPIKGEGIEAMGFQQFIQPNPPNQRPVMKKPKRPIEQYPVWIALAVDETGVIRCYSSHALKSHRGTIMATASDKLENLLRTRSLELPDNIAQSMDSFATPQPILDPNRSMSGQDFNVNPHFQRPAKRHRSSTTPFTNMTNIPEPAKREPKSLPRKTQTIQIQVGDHDAMVKWFSEAFRAVQQIGCRLIAKVWIKKIHPKKQSTHPYNGGFPRDKPSDSNRTKPPYWPPGVRHKEPDHIDREARTALLVHLITNTPQPLIVNSPDSTNTRVISAQELLDSLEEKKHEFKADRWPIIQEIVKARTYMERFDAGEIDANFTIYLRDYSDNSKAALGDLEAEAVENDDLESMEDITTDDSQGERQVSNKEQSVLSSPMDQPKHDDRRPIAMKEPQSYHEHIDNNMINPVQIQHPSTVFNSPQSNISPMGGMHPCVSPMMPVDPNSFNGQMNNPGLNRMMADSRATRPMMDMGHQDLGLLDWQQHVPAYLHYPSDGMSVHIPDPHNFQMYQDVRQDDRQPNISPMDTAPYPDYNPNNHRALPVRSMSEAHGSMISPTHDMTMMQGQFYPG